MLDSPSGPAGSLVEWLLRRNLLRGPFLFVDYWASALGLPGQVRDRHLREGWVDRSLFRVGLDRPDLELPRARYYLLLFFLGPLLLPFRAFRRLGRYRIRFRREVGETVLSALADHRLRLEERGPGRVRVTAGSTVLAEELLDPRLISGFSSLFYAVYKIPLASLTAIAAVGILTPLLSATGGLELVLRYWIPVGFPALALLLYVVYRDWVTAVLGAFPVIVGRYLLLLLHPSVVESWLPFFLALGGLFLLYVAADWFFMPRTVPPVLLFYTRDEPGRPYAHEHDAPYWLEGSAYWVWRYLMLTPAELNKFWERDWERVELWIRADGPAAGALEWVVTDAHYRELWTAYERLGTGPRPARHRESALRHSREARPGTWLVEVDADLVFHTPFVRGVSFVPEEGDVPALGIGHLMNALWSRRPRDPSEPYLRRLDRLKVDRGEGVLDDIPEAAVGWAARQMLRRPWSYWRYPLGASRRREPRLYGREARQPPVRAADPGLQIKAPDPAVWNGPRMADPRGSGGEGEAGESGQKGEKARRARRERRERRARRERRERGDGEERRRDVS
ncbi:MAG: hypothetical protein ACE5HP_02625 [Gemmatimonadota bacterium]